MPELCFEIYICILDVFTPNFIASNCLMDYLLIFNSKIRCMVHVNRSRLVNACSLLISCTEFARIEKHAANAYAPTSTVMKCIINTVNTICHAM